MMLLPHCVRFNLYHGVHAGLYGELLPHLAPARAAELGPGAMPAERDLAFCDELFAMNEHCHEQYGVPLKLSELGVAHDQLPAVAKQARYDGAALYNEAEITLDEMCIRDRGRAVWDRGRREGSGICSRAVCSRKHCFQVVRQPHRLISNSPVGLVSQREALRCPRSWGWR